MCFIIIAVSKCWNQHQSSVYYYYVVLCSWNCVTVTVTYSYSHTDEWMTKQYRSKEHCITRIFDVDFSVLHSSKCYILCLLCLQCRCHNLNQRARRDRSLIQRSLADSTWIRITLFAVIKCLLFCVNVCTSGLISISLSYLQMDKCSFSCLQCRLDAIIYLAC
jgi:hypothetical protein